MEDYLVIVSRLLPKNRNLEKNQDVSIEITSEINIKLQAINYRNFSMVLKSRAV